MVEPRGGDSHIEIGVIPMLGDSLYEYTCEYRHGARAWQEFVANLSM
jgi:hypothetical protein